MPTFLTKEGFEKIKNEIHHLKTTGRAEAGAALAEAREKGDLSENAEYDAAKEEQAKLEKRIAMLEMALTDVRILEDRERPPGSTISIGSVGATSTLPRHPS